MEEILAAHSTFMKLNSGDDSGLASIRKNGIQEFQSLGFPLSSDEDWKFSNLKKVSSFLSRYKNTSHKSQKSLDEVSAFLQKKNIGKNKIVFLNGRLIKELSELNIKGKYIAVEKVSGSEEHPQAPLFHLNRAFLNASLELSVEKNVKADDPIWIVNVLTEGGVSNTSLKVNLGENSTTELAEVSFSLDNVPGFVNMTSDINAESGAKLNHFIFQALGLHDGVSHHLTLNLEKDSDVTTVNVADKYAWSRNSVVAKLKSEGASISLFGLNLPTAEQFVDHCLKVIHAAPLTISRQLYKGVLSGKSKSIFNGKITINRGSKGASAEQLNKNIICDKSAEAITRPQLEINTDDVKATHGATIGKINLEELFYLESRGIPLDLARRILTEGFVREVLDLGMTSDMKAWALQQLNINELVTKNVV